MNAGSLLQGVAGLSHTASGEGLLPQGMPGTPLTATAGLGTKPMGREEPILAEFSDGLSLVLLK